MNTKETNPKEPIGVKKVSLSVVPIGVLMEVSVALLEGAAKYGRHNYREAGGRASIYYDATMRHLNKWWELGENIDPDSKLHHITKAISSLMVLRDVMIQDRFVDDRPPASLLDYNALEAIAADLVQNASQDVKHFTAENTKQEDRSKDLSYECTIDNVSYYSIDKHDFKMYLTYDNVRRYIKNDSYEYLTERQFSALTKTAAQQLVDEYENSLTSKRN